jgi:pulcherriminic acid synthase
MATTAAGRLMEDFNAVVDEQPGVDRHEVFARLRAELPVFFSDRLGAWVATRYEDVRLGLSDERFAPPKEGAGSSIFGRSFLQMSGREHNKKVGIVAREMRSPRALKERLDALVEQIAVERAASLPIGEPVDLREQYAMWIPLLAITELTGIREAASFRAWYRALVAAGVSSIKDPGAREAGFQARAELRACLAPIIEERRRNPGSDLVSDLVTAQYEGEPLPDEEIVTAVSFLLTAGIETTERVLTSAFKHLLLDREEWDVLRSRRHDDVALAAFSAEALRMYPPVNGTTRQALAPVELGGESIAEGDRLVVLMVSANRDADRFPDPDRFDRERFADRPDRQFTSAGDILSFGAGSHHCTGSRLAQIEMVHGFAKLLERVAWIEPAGELPPAEGFMLHSPPALPVILQAA